MSKIRVIFTQVEAGLGHIMPLNAIEEVFRAKYSDKFEIVHSNFYEDCDDKKLKEFSNVLVKRVVQYNKNPGFGYLTTIACDVFGTYISTFGTMKCKVPGSSKSGIRYMESLKPDVVFSTHWATNYYAQNMKNKPFTISYCPDAVMNKMFMYPADLTLISMPVGYAKAIKKRRYNENNLKLVPFLIRNEAFHIPTNKVENRKNLNLPLDKFTIVLAEGGYGIGKMKKICELLIKEHVPMTVIPVCGKNEKLFKYFKSLNSTEEVTFLPQGLTNRMLEFIASADLFCGKSGNIIAEPTFFGVPSIITNYATTIEENIGKHYLNVVGSSMKEFNPQKVVQMIEEFIKDPHLLDKYKDSALKYHENFGAEYTADLIYKEICKRFSIVEERSKNELYTNC